MIDNKARRLVFPADIISGFWQYAYSDTLSYRQQWPLYLKWKFWVNCLSCYTDQCAFSSVHIKRFIGWNQIETAAQGYSNFLRAGSVFDGSTTLVQLTIDWILVQFILFEINCTIFYTDLHEFEQTG